MLNPEHSWRYEGWRVALASAIGVLFSFGSLLVFTFGVFLKPLTQQFGWSREAVSAAFGVAALTLAVASPRLGAMLDREPRPSRILLPCFLAFGLAFASLSLLTPHLWHLYLIFFVFGVVGNGTAHLAYSGALTAWFNERRGVALAILMSGAGVGAALWPAIAQSFIAWRGWRFTFAALGAGILCIGLPAASRVRRPLAPRLAAGATPARPAAPVAPALRSRSFWIIIAILFAVSLSQNGAITHMAALLTDRGIPPATAAQAVSALGVASLLSRFLTGWLLDRFSAPRLAFLCVMASAAGTALLARAASPAAGFLAAVLIGFSIGAEVNLTPYLLSRYFPLGVFSTLYGLSWTAYAIAGAVGPALLGRAFDLTGSYTLLLLRLAALTAAAAFLTLLLPRYNERRATDETHVSEASRVAP